MTHRFRTIPKTSTTTRGYGAAHMRARKQAAARHQPTDPCARCGKPLGAMGRNLHYDHNAERTGYLGFSHATCNRKAGAQAGNRKQASKHPELRRKVKLSRVW